MHFFEIIENFISRRLDFLNSSDLRNQRIVSKYSNGKNYYYTFSEDNPKIHKRITEEEYYKIKKFNKALPSLKAELALLNVFVKTFNVFSKNYRKILQKYREISLEFQNTEDLFSDSSIDFEIDNTFYDNSRKFKTKRGEFVRSKSELIIADVLFDYGINYIYEPSMFDNRIHPDFIIFGNEFGRTVIWEHFGLMSDQAYALHSYKKLAFYEENGFILNYNLLVSMEFSCGTDESITFGREQAEKIVKTYLLNFI